jgi:hypothetical protein
MLYRVIQSDFRTGAYDPCRSPNPYTHTHTHTHTHTLKKRAVVFGQNWLRILSNYELQYAGLGFRGQLYQVWLIKPEGKG